MVPALVSPFGHDLWGLGDVRVVDVNVLVEILIEAMRSRTLVRFVIPFGPTAGLGEDVFSHGRSKFVRPPSDREQNMRQLPHRTRRAGIARASAIHQRNSRVAKRRERLREIRREHRDFVVHERVELGESVVEVVEILLPHLDGRRIVRKNGTLHPVQLRAERHQIAVDFHATAAQVEVWVDVRDRLVDELADETRVAYSRRQRDLVQLKIETRRRGSASFWSLTPRRPRREQRRTP
mmetsp:Transcript_15123/g.47508  ORF Transcript_15123/g.47508 Transcript_15123/m.47508 type:complete len:237 (+) Transcript_15123:988-1698(+)